jgi:hypothetical protein
MTTWTRTAVLSGSRGFLEGGEGEAGSGPVFLLPLLEALLDLAVAQDALLDGKQQQFEIAAAALIHGTAVLFPGFNPIRIRGFGHKYTL